MKKFMTFGLFAFILLALMACHVETSSSFGLRIQKAVLAKENTNGKLVPIPNAVFNRGDKIYYVLLNVGKFKKDAKGLNWFDMNMKVTGPDKQVILNKDNMLGGKAHVALQNDIAPSPHGIFTTSPRLKPGKYTIKLTIFDKIGKGSASSSTNLTLK